MFHQEKKHNMEYIEAAISLISLVKDTNTNLLLELEELIEKPNVMIMKMRGRDPEKVLMDAYTNEFVYDTLSENKDSESFVMTDIGSMDVKGEDVFYIIYKAYHSRVDKGVVFYQLIDKVAGKPKGALLFSNMEENVFYKVTTPDQEESSCNAIETKEKIENGKSIAFLIGHMDEERLVYDIERLLFDTANNVTKHQKLKFKFIIQISRFGGSPSAELKEKVAKIEAFTKNHLYPEYPNVEFTFQYEESSVL